MLIAPTDIEIEPQREYNFRHINIDIMKSNLGITIVALIAISMALVRKEGFQTTTTDPTVTWSGFILSGNLYPIISNPTDAANFKATVEGNPDGFSSFYRMQMPSKTLLWQSGTPLPAASDVPNAVEKYAMINTPPQVILESVLTAMLPSFQQSNPLSQYGVTIVDYIIQDSAGNYIDSKKAAVFPTAPIAPAPIAPAPIAPAPIAPAPIAPAPIAPAPAPAPTATTTTTAATTTSGTPTWVWIVVGIVGVIVLGLIIFFAMSGKGGNSSGYSYGKANNMYRNRAASV